ncbi:MAG: VOC family protein [Lysobacter sp.]
MADVPAAGEHEAQGVVEIVGPDIERSLAFYAALGFTIERRTGPFAVLIGFGVRLFLAENHDAPTDGRWTNLRIIVADIDAVWERVNRLGLSIRHPIGDRFYGLRDFVLADPSGFEIRFAQRIAP